MELSFDIGQGLVKGEWLGASLLADDPSPISSRISPTPQHVFAFASIKCDLHSEARPLQIPVIRDRARGDKQASERFKQVSPVWNWWKTQHVNFFVVRKWLIRDSLGNAKVSAV